MTDADTPELLHREQLDARGNPAGYALCDKGDGTFPGGLLAHNSAFANCEACEDWEPDDSDGYETDDEEGPEPRNGDRGTCATCGNEIEFIDPADGLPGVWRHVKMPADHTAQIGGPA